MKTFFAIVLTIIGLATNVLAQEFKITDYSISGCDASDANKLQKTWLGGSVSMVFFDKAVKLEKFYDSDGVEMAGMKFPILNKIDDYTYSFTDDKGKTVLKLNKIVAYIRSATIYVEDYKEKTSGRVKLTRK
ncbi:MAG: hypothetical protein ACOYU1_11275 [Bacteroidota bacterium]|nr:hypothetical protein C0T31_03690 [Dysgonamonadaceae bacterium]